jgi:hypothetical protein
LLLSAAEKFVAAGKCYLNRWIAALYQLLGGDTGSKGDFLSLFLFLKDRKRG